MKAIGHAGIKNAIKNRRTEDDRSYYTPDAELSDFGIRQAIIAKERLNSPDTVQGGSHRNYFDDYDFYLCSEMKRAIQTGLRYRKKRNTH